jgi:hypothetical protein
MLPPKPKKTKKKRRKHSEAGGLYELKIEEDPVKI